MDSPELIASVFSYRTADYEWIEGYYTPTGIQVITNRITLNGTILTEHHDDRKLSAA